MTAINDSKYNTLKSLGYMATTKNINEAEKAFWETFSGGGEFPDGTTAFRGKTGQSTQAADGIKTVFTIAHGLAVSPLYAAMISRTSVGVGVSFINWDATNITVTYVAAPLTGSVVINWIALIS